MDGRRGIVVVVCKQKRHQAGRRASIGVSSLALPSHLNLAVLPRPPQSNLPRFHTLLLLLLRPLPYTHVRRVLGPTHPHHTLGTTNRKRLKKTVKQVDGEGDAGKNRFPAVRRDVHRVCGREEAGIKAPRRSAWHLCFFVAHERNLSGFKIWIWIWIWVTCVWPFEVFHGFCVLDNKNWGGGREGQRDKDHLP